MYLTGLYVTLGFWVVLLTLSVIKGKLNEEGFKSVLPSIIVLPLLSWIGFVILLFATIIGLSKKDK